MLHRSPAAPRWILGSVLAALTAWFVAFVARSSVLIDGERHFFLFDDALISMSYARNLAAGLGPVWSPGSPPVEGFTNPLWTALMVPVNALPLPLHHRPLVVQVLGFALLAVTVWRLRELLLRHFRPSPEAAPGPTAWLLAAAVTAFHYSLSYWSFLGMETPLMALLAVLAVHLAYDIVYDRRDRYLALFAVLAAAYLTRMDMALLIVLVLGWMTALGGFRRSAARRWLAGAALLTATAVGYQVFRQVAFDAPLPNTYYLKLGGVPLDLRLERGLAKALVSLRENLLPVLAVVVAAATDLGRAIRGRDPGLTGGRRRTGQPVAAARRALADPVALPALLLAAYAAYSVWVGGDAWELPEINIGLNRFVVFLVPLAAVLVNDLWNRLGGRWEKRGWGWLTAAATLLFVLLGNGLLLSPRRGENLRKVTLQDRPALVESTVLVYVNLRKLQRRLAPGAKVVTYWAGVPAYFSDYELVDGLGYTDPHVARRPLPPEIGAANYRPGHNKSDAAYLVAQRPDAFFQFWDLDRLPVRWPRHHLRDLGYVQVGELWLRRDSPYLLPGALEPSTAVSPR